MNRFNFGSALTIGQQQLLTGYNTLTSHPPSPHAVSSSSCLPQITQQSNYSTDIVSPVSQSGGMGLDESESPRQYDAPQAIQHPPSAVSHYHSGEWLAGQSGGHVSWRTSRRDTTTSEPSSSMPIDPELFDFGKQFPLPQKHQDRQGHPWNPEGHAGAPNLQMYSVFHCTRELRRALKSAPFVGGNGGVQEQEGQSGSDDALGEYAPGLLTT